MLKILKYSNEDCLKDKLLLSMALLSYYKLRISSFPLIFYSFQHTSTTHTLPDIYYNIILHFPLFNVIMILWNKSHSNVSKAYWKKTKVLLIMSWVFCFFFPHTYQQHCGLIIIFWKSSRGFLLETMSLCWFIFFVLSLLCWRRRILLLWFLCVLFDMLYSSIRPFCFVDSISYVI